MQWWSLGLAVGAFAAACGPGGAQAPCDEDNPCDGRGQVCDLDLLRCVDEEVVLDSTENPAPDVFGGKVVPFFRGEVCTMLEVQSGTDLPVLMRPCLHPCMTTSSFEFRHTFQCTGSRCDALALMWVVADGNACPPDAFSSFDQASCNYATEVEFKISTATSDGPINGTMTLEVPFLSNADMESIAADPGNQANTTMLVEQYPQQLNRIVGGQSISILPGNAVAPDTCRDGACNCYPVGF